jgi:hypothetical protein
MVRSDINETITAADLYCVVNIIVSYTVDRQLNEIID